ncbi:MAG: hypothetical protein KDD62_02990 [Bdellovibrionales bacterium]|nr:hypothetical protein [Bdellovibrionales bacterium]
MQLQITDHAKSISVGGKTFATLSRREAEAYVLAAPHILISVVSAYEAFPDFVSQASRMAVLRLAIDDFHDDHRVIPIEELALNGVPAIFFEESHAQQIDAFVREHIAQVDFVISHCAGGQSRSAAISLALAEWYGGKSLPEVPYMSGHNPLVYKTLKAQLTKPGSWQSLDGTDFPSRTRFHS